MTNRQMLLCTATLLAAALVVMSCGAKARAAEPAQARENIGKGANSLDIGGTVFVTTDKIRGVACYSTAGKENVSISCVKVTPQSFQSQP